MTKLGLTAFLVLFAAGIFVNNQSRAAKSGGACNASAPSGDSVNKGTYSIEKDGTVWCNNTKGVHIECGHPNKCSDARQLKAGGAMSGPSGLKNAPTTWSNTGNKPGNETPVRGTEPGGKH
ncbi:MAG: hypothetical protein WA722_00670 [Candidatus Sulfotelmatobacter sp.]